MTPSMFISLLAILCFHLLVSCKKQGLEIIEPHVSQAAVEILNVDDSQESESEESVVDSTPRNPEMEETLRQIDRSILVGSMHGTRDKNRCDVLETEVDGTLIIQSVRYLVVFMSSGQVLYGDYLHDSSDCSGSSELTTTNGLFLVAESGVEDIWYMDTIIDEETIRTSIKVEDDVLYTASEHDLEGNPDFEGAAIFFKRTYNSSASASSEVR